MGGRGARGEIRPVGNGIDDLAPGENEHGGVIHRDRAEEREEQDISCQKQQLSRQELFRIDHAAEKARNERSKQNDYDAVETRHRAVDDRAVLAVDTPEIQRHEIAVLVVCRAAQRRHGKIQKDRRILAEDRKNALPVSRALILRAAADLFDRRDIPHEKPDEDRRAADGDAADDEREPQIVFEQQTAERRRKDKTEIRAPVQERVCLITLFEGRDIGNDGVVRRTLNGLEKAGDKHEHDRPHTERNASAKDVAHDRNDVADNDDVLLIEPVGKLAAEKRGRHHQNAEHRRKYGNVPGAHTELLVEDHREHGPDHRAHVRHDPPEEENIVLPAESPVL